ncbi:three prime repair exonuclease 2 [Tribolium castaneum]|uniref:exodeoxyribonuclease III n=1 Tax=Tribolium castaneum TaxID=7070 RepID=D6WI28_TRICA|nr:PREDICTED: three prime repair exonuclease 2 [Tribolium castaneum]EFA01254.1 three prime repair exonuclease [Tribolium castaneum]|eukprot:XP_008191467.1 PREDICTED: three prime repair exonuclease 2 [Tribolium castaneum]
MSEIKTFVFFDLETTGLPKFEENRTRITEFCAVAVRADHIGLQTAQKCKLPRVQSKLSLCFNPARAICPQATKLTGLSNELLEHQAHFSSQTLNVIKNWLDVNEKPICLVAHNGNEFDFPILRAEIENTGENLPEDILCLDSIIAFKEIDTLEGGAVINQPNEIKIRKIDTSYNLGHVFKRRLSKRPLNAHGAEGDVNMLLACAADYGQKFVKFANGNSTKFSQMPIMKPKF